MGKASRRRKHTATAGTPQAAGTSRGGRGGTATLTAKQRRAAAVPFARRPFEGLASETEWVAIRELLPAATATVTLTAPTDTTSTTTDSTSTTTDSAAPDTTDTAADTTNTAAADTTDTAADTTATTATVATVLPLAWPALRRADGEIFIGTQSGGSTGDASRDLAASLLAAAAAEPGTPLPTVPTATADTPRLQDLLDPAAPFTVDLHDGFEFWASKDDLNDEMRASLERANESIVPTKRLSSMTSAYWVQIGDRTYVRIVLPEDEGTATDALARLHAAGEAHLGEDTRLLGAFRACGLLIPVIEVPADADAADHESALATFADRYAAALASTQPLTSDERRSKSGLLSRQDTL